MQITDPLTGQQGPFPMLKWALQDDFSGLVNDARQQQVANVRQFYHGFRARLATLKASCEHCHASERRYYVDDASMALVEQLGDLVQETPLRPVAILDQSRAINETICFQCHLVHMLAAFSRGH